MQYKKLKEQEEISKLTGWPQSSISAFFNGNRNPTMGSIKSASENSGIPANFFFEDREVLLEIMRYIISGKVVKEFESKYKNKPEFAPIFEK